MLMYDGYLTLDTDIVVDLLPNAHQMFIDITEAYEVLRDYNKREKYNKVYNFYKRKTDIKVDKFAQEKKKWSDFGKQKAEEYSSMSFDAFIERAINEVKIGANHAPFLIAVFFVGMFGLSIFLYTIEELFKQDNLSGFIGLLFSFGMLYFAFFLAKKLYNQYQDERRRFINIKK